MISSRVPAVPVHDDRVRVVEPRQHVDPAAGAEHPRLAGRRAAQRGEQGGAATVRRSPAAPPPRRPPRRRPARRARHRVRVAQHHLGERDRVDAHVEQRAAAERRVEEPVGGSGGGCTPRSACTARTSPIAPSAISSRIRTITGRKRVHIASIANTPGLRGERGDLPGGRRGHRERLLDQHRLAGPRSRPARSPGAAGAGWRCRARRRRRRRGSPGTSRGCGRIPCSAANAAARSPTATRRRPAGAVDVREVAHHLGRDPTRPDDSPAHLSMPVILADGPSAHSEAGRQRHHEHRHDEQEDRSGRRPTPARPPFVRRRPRRSGSRPRARRRGRAARRPQAGRTPARRGSSRC